MIKTLILRISSTVEKHAACALFFDRRKVTEESHQDRETRKTCLSAIHAYLKDYFKLSYP